VRPALKIEEMLIVACKCELGTNFSVLNFMTIKVCSCNVSAAKCYENFIRESVIAFKVIGRLQKLIMLCFTLIS